MSRSVIEGRPIDQIDEATKAEAFDRIDRATLYLDRLVIDLQLGGGNSPIVHPIRMDRTRAEVIVTGRDPASQPVVPKIDKSLVRALARAYSMRLKLESGEASSVTDLAAQFGLADSYIRKILPIGFLAPDLMEQILDGRQPPRLKLGHITDDRLPLGWVAQRELFADLQR